MGFLVDPLTRPKRKQLDLSCRPDAIDQPELADPQAPKPCKSLLQRLAAARIDGNRFERSSQFSLDVRMQTAYQRGQRRRNPQLVRRACHRRSYFSSSASV